VPLLVPPATAPRAGRPARGIGQVGDLEYHRSTSEDPEYPLKYLDGDGRAVESATVHRRRRALAEERLIRRVEVEHRRRRVERVPACGTWWCVSTTSLNGECRIGAPLGKSAESHLTYIAVAILRSCFAALTTAALVTSLEAWCMSRSSLLRTRGCACAHARTDARAHAPLGTP
jgi:hypothetical protein